eukprot:GHVT01032751.1.p1 GENE.GHVT01032751.1~~GHVT01032751.1.p1  ORF type:complete len:310 (+),score=74.43 GHVT01032751.1:883-1812(+)
MSYGWLTESSLQPRRARELHVTAGSLLSLSAALAETEAKAEKRRGAGHAAVTKRALFGDETFRDTTAALRITRPSKKPRTPGEAMFETRNEGVEERMAKDKAAHAKSAKTIANSRMKLEEKAKLYDALARGDATGADDRQQLLVDFSRKPNAPCARSHRKSVDDDVHQSHLPGDRSARPTGAPPPRPAARKGPAYPAENDCEETEDLQLLRLRLGWEHAASGAPDCAAALPLPAARHTLLQRDDEAAQNARTFLLNLSQETESLRQLIGSARKKRREALKERLLRLRMGASQTAAKPLPAAGDTDGGDR